MRMLKLLIAVIPFGLSLAATAPTSPKVLPPYFELVKDGAELALSAQGVTFSPEVTAALMAPRGAVVLTPAGNLSAKGIRHIIHAATGSMTRSGEAFVPSGEGIKLSIKNSLLLAAKKHSSCLALPFLGGGIFFHALKLDKAGLGGLILDALIQERPSIKVVVVTWGEEDTGIFRKLFAARGKAIPATVSLKPGSITDFKVHGCSAIVNAANMEITFGGGLSGLIGKETGQEEKINGWARDLLRAYYQQRP